MRAVGREPLLVISASNDGIDASYSGLNHAAVRVADSAQVLVVGGIRQTGAIDDSSNYGRLVSIYAPSRDVAVLRTADSVALRNGTSAAAPLVAGTAGLLVSFDPRPHMTAAELKRLILAGATDSIVEPSGAKKIARRSAASAHASRNRLAPSLDHARVSMKSGSRQLSLKR
ncbi:MAG: S8 family serine peptidase [Gemmatimonadaceae bacterium]